MRPALARVLLVGALAPAACGHGSSGTPAPGGGPEAGTGAAPLAFDERVLDTAFRAEGVAVFDVDRDGRLDIVTDQYWYAGPDFVPHEIRTPEAFDPATQFSVCFAVFGEDRNGDGWTDAVVIPRDFDPAAPPAEPVLWYENPKGADAHWTPHELAPSTEMETAVEADLFGDGVVEILMGVQATATLAWLVPGADPTMSWEAHPISPAGFQGAGPFQHGLGVGDVDADGRLDVLTGYGWFQQTSDPATWPLHAVPFGPGVCSTMYAYDVDGDGLRDVLCAHAHDYGLHWWQQQPPARPGADATFVDHLIDDTISQMHALVLADLDGDGVPEIVTGKRFWAHGPDGDPGVNDPAVLTYYAIRRDGAGGVTFERHDIDGDSGVGTEFVVTDVDRDGHPDIVVSNKKGLFLFRQQ